MVSGAGQQARSGDGQVVMRVHITQCPCSPAIATDVTWGAGRHAGFMPYPPVFGRWPCGPGYSLSGVPEQVRQQGKDPAAQDAAHDDHGHDPHFAHNAFRMVHGTARMDAACGGHWRIDHGCHGVTSRGAEAPKKRLRFVTGGA